ncbi:MAG: NUDIX hydrolase [Methylococcales bacterium]|nr:NUDIX hydrolase [Methylococcales bacterium]
MVWKPHVTVAAVIERDGRFLLVEEHTPDGIAFNQPAGHLEPGETLTDAVRREVLEETAWQFEPQAVIAVQLWRRNPESPSFVRFCFCGEIHSHNPEQALDDGIIGVHWLTHADVIQHGDQLRSPLVRRSLEAYLNGSRYPLSILQSFIDSA